MSLVPGPALHQFRQFREHPGLNQVICEVAQGIGAVGSPAFGMVQVILRDTPVVRRKTDLLFKEIGEGTVNDGPVGTAVTHFPAQKAPPGSQNTLPHLFFVTACMFGQPCRGHGLRSHGQQPKHGFVQISPGFPPFLPFCLLHALPEQAVVSPQPQRQFVQAQRVEARLTL